MKASASASLRPAAVIVSGGRQGVASIVVRRRNVHEFYEQKLVASESVSIRREDESRNSSCGWTTG
jgi:hypothetical protein